MYRHTYVMKYVPRFFFVPPLLRFLFSFSLSLLANSFHSRLIYFPLFLPSFLSSLLLLHRQRFHNFHPVSLQLSLSLVTKVSSNLFPNVFRLKRRGGKVEFTFETRASADINPRKSEQWVSIGLWGSTIRNFRINIVVECVGGNTTKSRPVSFISNRAVFSPPLPPSVSIWFSRVASRLGWSVDSRWFSIKIPSSFHLVSLFSAVLNLKSGNRDEGRI